MSRFSAIFAFVPATASVGPCVVELRVGALAPLAQIAASILARGERRGLG